MIKRTWRVVRRPLKEKTTKKRRKVLRGLPKERHVPVENEVIWVNKKVKLPEKWKKVFKEGKKSSLGLFRSTKWSIKSPVGVGLRTTVYHRRSALFPDIVEIKDNKGKVYRHLDFKGAGLNQSDIEVEGDRGILDLPAANRVIDVWEKFHELGIRTELPIAIIKLREIVHEGKKIPVNEAHEKGIIDTERPVVLVRGFRTKWRIDDIITTQEKKERRKIVEDAIEHLKEELGKKEISIEDYVRWMGKTLGEQLAILHNNGITHELLTSHNITLTGEIVDLDSARGIYSFEYENSRKFERSILKDHNHMRRSLEILCESGLEKIYDKGGLREEILESFRDGYWNNLRKEIKKIIEKNSKEYGKDN